MSTKDLKDKAIDFKGKKYVLVSDRVLFFNEAYPNGSIRTDKTQLDERVEIKATIIPDVTNLERYFTGYSQAVWGEGYINKTSALENAETSAVGRALAFMGIGVLDSIASIDEINKTTHYTPKKTGGALDPFETPKRATPQNLAPTATMAGHVYKPCKRCGVAVPKDQEEESMRVFGEVLHTKCEPF